MRAKYRVTQQDVMTLEGKSERWVRKHAMKLGVHHTGKRSSNGRLVPVFDVRCLSEEAQRRWARSQKVVPIATVDEPGESATSPGQVSLDLVTPIGVNLSPEDQAEAERRYRVIEPIVVPERYRGLHARFPNKVALIDYLGSQHGVSRRTLYNWVNRWTGKADPLRRGLPALVDPARRDKGKPRKINAAGLDLMVKLLTPHWNGKRGYGELNMARAWGEYHGHRRSRMALAGKVLENGDAKGLWNYVDEDGRLLEEAQLPVCSYETFRRWAAELPKPAKVLARRGTEAFKNSQLPYSYRDYQKLKPLDFVVMDHRELDLFCLMPKRGGGYRVGRPWVTAAIDMCSRKWLSWVIVETPNSDSIAAVLKSVISAHGRPKGFYWDNGQDFECKWLDGFLTGLGTRVTHSLVRNARAKMSEPNFKALALFERETPWWVGHKPGARPERLADVLAQHKRWMAGEDERAFQTLNEIGDLYGQLFPDLNARPHTGDGMEKVTPEGRAWKTADERWNELIGKVARETVPRDALLFMFRKQRKLKVKHGQVQMSYRGKRCIYHPAAEDDPLALIPYNDKEITVWYDHLDLQRVAVFYRGKVVCWAENLELRGMGEDAFKADEADRRRAHRLFRALITASHEQLDVPTPIERLEARRATASSEPEPPRPEVAIAYPEAQQAIASGAPRPVSPAPLKTHEPGDDQGGEFDLFGGGDE